MIVHTCNFPLGVRWFVPCTYSGVSDVGGVGGCGKGEGEKGEGGRSALPSRGLPPGEGASGFTCREEEGSGCWSTIMAEGGGTDLEHGPEVALCGFQEAEELLGVARGRWGKVGVARVLSEHVHKTLPDGL